MPEEKSSERPQILSGLVPTQQASASASTDNFPPLPSITSQAATVIEQSPVPAGGDLFSMLNQNISQNNQIPSSGSAFNFIQNQSLSMSAKSDTTFPTTTANQTPTVGASKNPAATVDGLDDFEQLSESREIIEDRIFRLKLQIVDMTIMQQDLSDKQETLAADIKILQNQRVEARRNEAQAAECEDYDEAEKLNLKIQSIKQLIIAKEAHKKKLDEDTVSLESRKGDKYVELGQVVQKSKARLNEIRTT